MSRTAIACLVCLLVAGCAAPTATTPTADTATPAGGTGSSSGETTATSSDAAGGTTAGIEDGIAVSGGSLPFDHERAFDRTRALIGVDVSPPTVIVIESAAEIRADTGGAPVPDGNATSRSFLGVMGVGTDTGSEEGDDTSGETDGDGSGDDSSDEGVSVAAYAPSAHSVVVNERMTTSERERVLERTLVHEYVHNVQFHQSAFGRLRDALDLHRDHSRDRYLTYASIIEGTAVYVAEEYDRRYLEGDWATVTTTERYRSSSSGVKYAIARYYFGHRYLQHRFASPRNISAVYADPPRSTEQLLHNDTDNSMEPLPLSLSVFPGEDRATGRTTTNGELVTRIALGTQLDESRAAAAAAGWGADRLVPVVPDEGNRSFVWATRWDSRSEADEFEASLRDYLVSRAAHSGGLWRDGILAFRVVRVSDETVVLLAGTESFVRNASVSGTNASVEVSARGA